MELTDRERRILAELERQFPAGASPPAAPGPGAAPRRRGIRPGWTILPAAVLGVLLLASGIGLHVGSAGLAGLLLLGWWGAPWLPGLLRRAGRLLLDALKDVPPGATH